MKNILHLLPLAMLLAFNRSPGSPAGTENDARKNITQGIARTVLDTSSKSTGLAIDSLIAEVLAKNPGLHAARSRTQSAEGRIPQARAWDDLQAGVDFFATPVTTFNPFNTMEKDYYLQQMIPFPGKKAAMADAARAGARMTEQSAVTTERDLVAQTKRAYAMLYSAQRRIQVNEENQRLLNQIIESARAKYTVGLTTQGDVLKVQVELARLQNERATLDQELASAEAMMNTLRAAPTTTPIGRVADIVPQAPTGTIEQMNARALDARPELRGMQFEVQMNQAEVSAAKREYFPDLMVRGMYKQMADLPNQWSAMVGVNIPIAPWSIGKYSGRVEETEASVQASQQSLANMRNMVQSQVRDTWTKVQSQWQQVQRYQQTIMPQAEQTLQSTLAAYQTDRTDFLSLLDSYRMLQMLRMEYYMLVGEYYTSQANLERAVGTTVQ